MRSGLNFLVRFLTVGGLLVAGLAFAQELTSTNYKVQDPVVFPGGYSGNSTSDSFRLTSIISQLVTGTSTGAGTFKVNSGFLFFPAVSTPTLSATAGDASVALSWTAATGYLGWTVSSYIVGQSTTSGGPYTYTDVGSVTSSTRSGLTNGTTYYFVIRPADAFGFGIATSSQASATPAAATPTPTPTPSPSSGGGGGGGAGGGYVSPSGATLVFSGKSYPKSVVTLLRDAQVAASVTANSDSTFSIRLDNVTPGMYLFSVYAEDFKGRRSSLLSFPVSAVANIFTTVDGIFVPPTIAIDKSEVKKGDAITIDGQSAKQAEVTILVHSDNEYAVKAAAAADGKYVYDFNTDPLEYGQHFTKSLASHQGQVSIFSPVLAFLVGTKNVFTVTSTKCPLKGDVNGDCRVNLVDFSITAYWWKRPLTQQAKDQVDAKLFPDGAINLRDFSILAYYWTG